MKIEFTRAVLGAALAATCASASAQNFPAKEVTLVVNYGAGGNTDVAARAVARGMEKSLEKPVVVQNRAGAMGTLGPSFVAKQRPDGYTIGMVTYSTIAITPHLLNVDYTVKDFEFLAGVGRYRYGVAVRADSPYKNIADLVQAAKTGKGIFFGAPSAPNNLALLELGRKTGGKFEQVSYKSGSETVNALLGGQVEVIVQNPSDVLSFIKAGKVRLLASASPVRWPELPDVQTMKEQGFDVEIDSWLGLAAPKGTPKAAVDKLQASMLQAMNTEEVKQQFVNAGVDPTALSGKEYNDLLVKGYETMGAAIKAANLPKIQP
jgi:tripartite-type tricarboxylate transporter receptor subunit TctC